MATEIPASSAALPEARRCDRCVLTEADSGYRWILPLSGSASIRLGRDTVWSAPEVLHGAVELSRVAYESDPGFTEWTVRPVRQGLDSVRFTGRPNPPEDRAPHTAVTFAFEVTE